MKKLLLIILIITNQICEAQSPILTVKSIDSALVKMTQMLTNTKIVGSIAYTTTEMHFYNNSNKQMEAELLFPLPEGVTVSRYAIDINGKMREAVPVNKTKGKQVFEALEHRRVDPGLLEKVEGNNFKTRIYPLMPKGERIVLIGYEQALQSFDKNNLSYQLLSKYKMPLEKYEVSIAVLDAINTPEAMHNSDATEPLVWTKNNQTTIKKLNYQPQENVIIKIPIQQNVANVFMQTVTDQHYFYSTIPIEANKIKKKTPSSIGIIWDNSLSCQSKNIKKEFDLLDTYFAEIKNTTVTLYFLNYFFTKNETFIIANGNWSALKSRLEATQYDGGTRFSQIQFGKEDEYLFFTDGLSSLSENSISQNKKPVYTISSSASADFAFMNYFSQKTAASFINLNELEIPIAANKLLYKSLNFLGIRENNSVTEIYPSIGTSVSGNFSIAGISLTPNTEVMALFGYGNEVTFEKKIMLQATTQNNIELNIEKIWAQKKVADLELQPLKNVDEIEQVGKRYGIVTQGTSLIVLENVNDYIAYEIMPPAELRAEYDRILKQQQTAAKAQQQSNWNNVENYFTSLFDWWKKDIKYKEPKQVPITKRKKLSTNERTYYTNSSNKQAELSEVVVTAVGTQREVEKDEDDKSALGIRRQQRQLGYATTISPSAALSGKVAGMQVNTSTSLETVRIRGIASLKNNNADSITYKSKEADKRVFDNGIKTNQWSPDRLYLRAITASATKNKYSVYLQLRESQINNPNFYYDVAYYFYNIGDKEKAILILSNIADLGLENHQLYKTLTYTLREWEQYSDALFTAKQIAKWRPFEPQSLRDLALTLEDNKQYQAAFDELVKALQVNYYGNMAGHYEGIEDIILMDLNRMKEQHETIKTDAISKKYLKQMPVSVRVILNWNQMDVDIDLHVIEPNNEECYYGHTNTVAGARFSKDFTQGYGPEQYLLRNSMKGRYKIKSNFYGETTLTENGPATVMVEIYIRKANGNIERKLKVVQSGKVKEDEALATLNID